MFPRRFSLLPAPGVSCKEVGGEGDLRAGVWPRRVSKTFFSAQHKERLPVENNVDEVE